MPSMVKWKTGKQKGSALSGDFGEAQLPTLSFYHMRLIAHISSQFTSIIHRSL